MPIALLLLSALSISLAAGEKRRKEPIDPKARRANTAYTLKQGEVQLGLVRQSVGVLDNLQVGTTAPLWVLGVPNVQGKVTAIQTRRVDVSLDGGYYRSGLRGLLGEEGSVVATPVGWMASVVLHERFSVHAGTAWTNASVNGSLSADQIADALTAVVGVDISEDIQSALGDQTGLYAGADLGLFSTRLSADFRLNRRDSIVLTSNNYLYLNGLLAAGVDTEANGGTEVQGGASARVRIPLSESLPALTTLSWQFDWRRVNLRVGIPLPLRNTFAYFQAFDLNIVLGRERTRRRLERDSAAPGHAEPAAPAL